MAEFDLRSDHETGKRIKTGDDIADVSLVIPIFNEADNLLPLYERLRPVLDGLDGTCEMILVDDGSTDHGYGILKSLSERDHRVRIIRLRRNFGQSAALSAGFDSAVGDVIVTMDADLQNDPEDIPRLLQKINEGYDVVSGWRIHRQDPLFTRRVPSRVANFIISKITGIHLHDYGCTLKAYKSEVVRHVKLYGEMHRLIPALASWMGVRITEIPVNHDRRKHGKSKYGLKRTFTVILDLFTIKFLLNYATRPMQVFGVMGGLLLLVGMGLGIYLSILKLIFSQGLSGRPLLLLAILLILFGTLLVMMGLLGELVVRTYHETQGKAIYMVRETLNLNEHSDSEEEAAPEIRASF